MTLIIVGQCDATHLGAWIGRLLRLIALVALVLMPIDMGMAPASAATPVAHTSMGMQSSGHCGDQAGKNSTKPFGTHCGSTCSALPDPAKPALGKALPPSSHQTPSRVLALVGISPAPLIPPPKTV